MTDRPGSKDQDKINCDAAPSLRLMPGAAKTGGFHYDAAAGACNHARRAPGGYQRLKLRMS